MCGTTSAQAYSSNYTNNARSLRDLDSFCNTHVRSLNVISADALGCQMGLSCTVSELKLNKM